MLHEDRVEKLLDEILSELKQLNRTIKPKQRVYNYRKNPSLDMLAEAITEALLINEAGLDIDQIQTYLVDRPGMKFESTNVAKLLETYLGRIMRFPGSAIVKLNGLYKHVSAEERSALTIGT